MPRLLPVCLLVLSLPAAAENLRIVTFNVRYANPQDGPNIWENRRDLFVRTVKSLAPDVMGTQELLRSQADDIAKALPEYSWFGIGRRGDAADEHMGVFYRAGRLELLDHSHFWLSEESWKPGSSAWNMSLPRMATWGLFRDRRTGRRFLLLNTHYAHRSQDEEARGQSSALIARRIGLLDPTIPLVITGDFNAPSGSAAYTALVPPMKDSWMEAATKDGPEGTFHNFSGKPGNARIDWILFRAPWKVLESRTVTANQDGRYPSDHFPVLAVFQLD
jgi:endonuclease/exonuclease/phosphatase family metal-dependent hydrolase